MYISKASHGIPSTHSPNVDSKLYERNEEEDLDLISSTSLLSHILEFLCGRTV
jgi:hypothetical protein